MEHIFLEGSSLAPTGISTEATKPIDDTVDDLTYI